MSSLITRGIWSTADDVQRIASAVLRAVPERVCAPLTKLGEGFAHLALETPDGLVVMVGKNYMAPPDRAVALRLLPALHDRLPVVVPRPLWALESAEGLPFGVYAYKKLQGVSMELEPTQASVVPYVPQIAEIIVTMSAFPVEEARSLGVQKPSEFRSALRACRSEIAPALRHLLTAGESSSLDRWWNDFEADSALLDAPVMLVHGDFWASNILVDTASKRVTGVLDFANARLGDVASDFATLRHNCAEFTDACIKSYVASGGVLGPHFEHRLERYWQLRSSSIFSFQAALRLHDDAELADCLSDLRNGPILA